MNIGNSPVLGTSSHFFSSFDTFSGVYIDMIFMALVLKKLLHTRGSLPCSLAV